MAIISVLVDLVYRLLDPRSPVSVRRRMTAGPSTSPTGAGGAIRRADESDPGSLRAQRTFPVVRRFMRNKLAVTGLNVSVILDRVEIIGPLISPYPDDQITARHALARAERRAHLVRSGGDLHRRARLHFDGWRLARRPRPGASNASGRPDR